MLFERRRFARAQPFVLAEGGRKDEDLETTYMVFLFKNDWAENYEFESP